MPDSLKSRNFVEHLLRKQEVETPHPGHGIVELQTRKLCDETHQTAGLDDEWNREPRMNGSQTPILASTRVTTASGLKYRDRDHNSGAGPHPSTNTDRAARSSSRRRACPSITAASQK